MVNALVELNDSTNVVLNVIKAKYGFRNKGEAIQFVVTKYVEQEEPELRPEFVEKIRAIEKQKSVLVNDFAKRYRLK